MKIQTLEITPEQAKIYLSKNDKNRSTKKKVIARYAEDMRSGNWIAETGETIKIATGGRVLDGQHRLMAIVQAGVPVKMQVASECDDSIFAVIDTGAKRTSADVLSIEGIKNHTALSAVMVQYLYAKKREPFAQFRSRNKCDNPQRVQSKSAVMGWNNYQYASLAPAF